MKQTTYLNYSLYIKTTHHTRKAFPDHPEKPVFLVCKMRKNYALYVATAVPKFKIFSYTNIN